MFGVLLKPAAVGDRAKVFYRPKTPALRVVKRVKTGTPGSENTITVDGPTDGRITLRGRIAADSDPALQIVRIPDPAGFARSAFVQLCVSRASPSGRAPPDRIRARSCPRSAR